METEKQANAVVSFYLNGEFDLAILVVNGSDP